MAEDVENNLATRTAQRLDRVEDAQHPKADQPEAENAHADILRRRGGEKPKQRKQAIKGEEENAGTGHIGGSFPG
jgi:hypothetical protein